MTHLTRRLSSQPLASRSQWSRCRLPVSTSHALWRNVVCRARTVPCSRSDLECNALTLHRDLVASHLASHLGCPVSLALSPASKLPSFSEYHYRPLLVSRVWARIRSIP